MEKSFPDPQTRCTNGSFQVSGRNMTGMEQIVDLNVLAGQNRG
ncbi:hypothetical protein [Methanoregula sp.]